MRIRDARPGDERAVADVHVRSWKTAYRGLLPDDYLDALRPEDRIPGYAFGSTSDPVTLLALGEDGGLLGFATFGASRDDDAPAAGELFALYVDPDRRRTGTGRALLDQTRARLAERGHGEAIAWVLRGNEDAERFYEADGWARDGATRWEDPWGVRSEVFRLRRALTTGGASAASR
ncbi:MAG TPA: GNAT family N-acetyltransferase [Solirubrobacteraceae bacterium]|nr:GNAT family N-acetyltransferase [Solirubrobacteraceae bacterium]